ncbi:hypothetical protein PROFUN_01753 [Planoprotostelium fungivorum]|uniref:Uncharacterized protein n=1 Tax=Planoprotostelium fungivorum TaxID=1890364 RepID=A0A2P6MWG3_9EUKA|nr:hypothetical protein PROFUN_01753 [Planoprotostelium fungivorum]
MKRQRIDEHHGVPTQKFPLDTRATIVICVPPMDRPYVSLIDDPAREMLAELFNNTEKSDAVRTFWTTVNEVNRSGTKKAEVFFLSGRFVRIKYRKTSSNGAPAIILTAKYLTGEPEARALRLMSSHGLPSEISGIAQVIEENVIGRLLGIQHLRVSIIDYPQKSLFRFLSVDPPTAALWHTDIHKMIGRTSAELNMSLEISGNLRESFSSHLDPISKTSTFTEYVNHFPGLSFFVAMRELLPGVHLIVAVTHDLKKESPAPSPERASLPFNDLSGVQIWKRKTWDEITENCLHYISLHTHHASTERLTLPDAFLEDEKMVYCYAYTSDKGAFLPSGNQDGYIWKSSRGVVNTVGNLKKKYQYVDLPNGKKLRRRVMWLEEVKNVYMVEYRHSENNNTTSDKLLGPECMDWPKLLCEVHAVNQHITNSINQIGSHFSMAETRETEEVGPDGVMSYVNSILSRFASEYGSP